MTELNVLVSSQFLVSVTKCVCSWGVESSIGPLSISEYLSALDVAKDSALLSYSQEVEAAREELASRVFMSGTSLDPLLCANFACFC